MINALSKNGEPDQNVVNNTNLFFVYNAVPVSKIKSEDELRELVFKSNTDTIDMKDSNWVVTEYKPSNEYFERKSINYNINSNDNDISKKIVKIIVEVDKSQAYRVYDEFSEENISKAENGNFKVIMENYENEWLYGYLLSFGEYLKIIAPERIKNILSHKIEQMKKNYL